ncbi:MAG: Lipid A 1-diphosphate synthase [Chlamydiia bacterium]|nr:Lipid A 1-diphosphate synthase [Chlamydiia bacterium]
MTRWQTDTDFRVISKLLLTIAILFSSWFLPPFSHFWAWLDIKGFLLLNSWIRESDVWQSFWGIGNCPITDWMYDIVMAGFFIHYIFNEKGKRGYRFAQFFSALILVSCVLMFVNRHLFSTILDIPRLSPSNVIEGCVRLSQEIHWMHIKDSSGHCYPGDHGTTILLFCSSVHFLAGRKRGLFALFCSIPFLLPRLIVGAHWLTDVIMGSFLIALLYQAIFYYTPIFAMLADSLYAGGARIGSLFKQGKVKEQVYE